jgi:hypothetical protein
LAHVPTEKVVTEWRLLIPADVMETLFWQAAGPLIGDDEPSAVTLAGITVLAADGMLGARIADGVTAVVGPDLRRLARARDEILGARRVAGLPAQGLAECAIQETTGDAWASEWAS